MKESEPQQEVSPEDQAKAKRALNILYVTMAVFTIAPFVVFFLFKKS